MKMLKFQNNSLTTTLPQLCWREEEDPNQLSPNMYNGISWLLRYLLRTDLFWWLFVKQMVGKIDGTITAEVVNIRLKRNVECMLHILKPLSVALDKLQKDGWWCWNLERNIKRHWRKEIMNKVKLQTVRKRMDQSFTPSPFFVNIVNPKYQGRCL